MTLQFAQPYWLVVGLCACFALLWFFRQTAAYKQRQLNNFASPELVERLVCHLSPRKLAVKNGLLCATMLLCFVALARPQYGYTWVDVKHRGIDLLFAIDTSRSMLAEDVKPNRLERAKFAIYDFVKKLEGDRVGLLPFAGSSYLMCPLTTDYSAFYQNLEAVDTSIIPKGGTNLAEVIRHAGQILRENSTNYKILIILTDGENLQGDAIDAAETAQKNKLIIHTVGVGTKEGELIPLPGQNQGFVRDLTGKLVQSKLDTAALTQIAEATGGIYSPLGQTGEGLETIYREKLALLPKTSQKERREKVPMERFQWPLAVAFLLYLMEMFLHNRKKRKKEREPPPAQGRAAHKKVAVLSFLMLIFSVGSSQVLSAKASDTNAPGEKLYGKQLAKEPENPVLQYNYGTILYKGKRYTEAIEAFSQALKSEDLLLQEKAYFNRGNGYYHAGAKDVEGKPEATIQAWEQALASFQAAIELNPANQKARHNFAKVKKELETLRHKQSEDRKKQSSKEEEKDKLQPEKQKESFGQKDQKDEKGQKDQKDQKRQKNKNTQKYTNKKNSKKNKDIKNNGEQQREDVSLSRQSSGGKEREGQTASSTSQKEEGVPEHALDKMSKKEAEQLLDMLKGEEKKLHFIPAPGHQDREPQQNW